jgi:hypothetical protein
MLAGTEYQKTLLENAILMWADNKPQRLQMAKDIYLPRPANHNAEWAWELMDKITRAEPKFYHAQGDIYAAFEEFVREKLHQNLSAHRDGRYMDSEQHLSYCIWQCIAEHGCFGTMYPELTGKRVEDWTSYSIVELDANGLIDKLKRWGYLQPVPLGTLEDQYRKKGPVPKWTVLYNIVTPGSTWIGTGWEFFDDETEAQKRFDHHVAIGNCPTKRPYSQPCDWQHLGAAHRM